MYASTPTIHTGISSLNSAVNPIISETFAPDPLVSANPLQIWIPVVSIIWVIGMVIMLIYTAVSYLRLNRRVKMAVLLRDNIYQSENVTSPFVLGVVHTRIYLPFTIADEDMFHVIAHEQTHIKRHDHWIKPIGFLLLTLYWFNPVLWMAYILLCRDIEFACDEKVIKEMDIDGRADYSQALLSCSISRKIIAACPLAFGEVGVKERVRNVLNYKKPAFWIIIVAVISCIAAAACFLTNPKSNSGDPDLSFLNYSNAISIVADMDEVMAVYCPPADSEGNGSIQMGTADGAKLANYLDRVTWDECNAPRESLSSPGSVEFIIEDDYRISIYKRKSWALFQYAKVKYGDEVRYYRTVRDDYEDAVAILKGQSEEGLDVAESRVLSLDNVIMLAEKGNDLTWADFDRYSYIETGFGLYIRVYEIDEMFSLRIGGSGTDTEPRYIYLQASDGGNEKIDIRTEDVQEFIDRHKDNPVMIRSYVFQESE